MTITLGRDELHVHIYAHFAAGVDLNQLESYSESVIKADGTGPDSELSKWPPQDQSNPQ